VVGTCAAVAGALLPTATSIAVAAITHLFLDRLMMTACIFRSNKSSTTTKVWKTLPIWASQLFLWGTVQGPWTRRWKWLQWVYEDLFIVRGSQNQAKKSWSSAPAFLRSNSCADT